jgi:hypothetical protein
VTDQIINFDVDIGNMTKPVPINIAGSWDLFQYYIANAMKCEESDLTLGFKLNTEPKAAKYHSVASETEYKLMQRAVTYELRKQSALLKKKTKKSSRPGATIKPLAISIQDMRSATEKKASVYYLLYYDIVHILYTYA